MRAIFLLLIGVAAAAQTASTLRDAVQGSAKHPSVLGAMEQAAAASAAVDLARTAWLPRADFIAQANRGTRNNIFGMILPQNVLPAISGPPLLSNELTSVWGSAVGVGIRWEPFDFGVRRAQLERAEAGLRRAEASSRVSELTLGSSAADAFLAALAAEQATLSAQASVERARVLLDVAGALVRAELRPGADASRAQTELLAAENQALLARSAVRGARAALTALTTLPGSTPLAAGRMLDEVPEEPAPATLQHPEIAEQQFTIAEVEASRKAAAASWYPRIEAQAASYARGSGAMPDGRTLGGINGLGPNIHNWGAGVTVTVPVLERSIARARERVEAGRLSAERARLQAIERRIQGTLAQARAEYEGAREVALRTPMQLEAARAVEQQNIARYKAGLATIADVADAQRLVAQAEVANALARLTAWRALLRVATAEGNLDTFLGKASGN